MEPGAVPEARRRTGVTGITGAAQFAETARQWRALATGQRHAVVDAYQRTLPVAAGAPQRVLTRVTQRQAQRPLLAGRDEGDAPTLRRVLGCREQARIWSAYSGVVPGDGTAVFALIERGTGVLLFVEYTLRPAEAVPGTASPADDLTAGAVRVTTYLWGGLRYAWPLLRPVVRAFLWRGIVAALRPGGAGEGGCRSDPG